MSRAVAALALLAATSLPPVAHAEAETFRVTGFCLQGTMRTGLWTQPGAVAVDPSVIPLYSTVSIEGLGTFTALDTGGGVNGHMIDVWFASCSDAINWGSQYRSVEWWP